MIFLCGLILHGCTGIDFWTEYDIDPGYPATYRKLNPREHNDLRERFLRDKDCNFITALNEFGFCAWGDGSRSTCQTVCTPFGRAQAESLTETFIAKNLEFLGIPSLSLVKDITYRSFDRGILCQGLDNVRWTATIGNQVVDGLEVHYTSISLSMNHDGVTQATGNWFPVVTIPPQERITYEQAKSLLMGRSFDFPCWSTIHIEITRNTQWGEPAKRKIVYPAWSEDAIRLHVVWVLQTDMAEFLVDVLTGEVITSYLQVIC